MCFKAANLRLYSVCEQKDDDDDDDDVLFGSVVVVSDDPCELERPRFIPPGPTEQQPNDLWDQMRCLMLEPPASDHANTHAREQTHENN